MFVNKTSDIIAKSSFVLFWEQCTDQLIDAKVGMGTVRESN